MSPTLNPPKYECSKDGTDLTAKVLTEVLEEVIVVSESEQPQEFKVQVTCPGVAEASKAAAPHPQVFSGTYS